MTTTTYTRPGTTNLRRVAWGGGGKWVAEQATRTCAAASGWVWQAQSWHATRGEAVVDALAASDGAAVIISTWPVECRLAPAPYHLDSATLREMWRYATNPG